MAYQAAVRAAVGVEQKGQVVGVQPLRARRAQHGQRMGAHDAVQLVQA